MWLDKALLLVCLLTTSCAFVPQQALPIQAVPTQRNRYIVPPIQSINDLASSIAIDLLPSPNESASEIISSIKKTKDLTAIEAIFPFLSRLTLSPMQVRGMIQIAIHQNSKLLRMIICPMVGFIVPYIGQYSRNFLSKGSIGKILRVEPLVSSDMYNRTKTYHIFNHLKQGLYLGAVNDFIDCFLDSTVVLGVRPKISTILSNACTSTSFSIWAMFRMKCYKNIMIDFMMRNRKNSNTLISNPVAVMKNVSNYLLYIFTGVVILDQIGVEYCLALKTLSLIGGVGTLVLGYASKEVATQLLSGLLITFENEFDIGDKIMYGGNDKAVGRVVEKDLLYTVVKDSDEVRVKIPNSELNVVSNISRGTKSRVKQSLKFKYDSLDKMPELIFLIKKEIVASCPKLIRQRIYLNSYELGYVEVIADARFEIVYRSNEYYAIRDTMMNAIGRAAKNCEAEFQDSLE